MSSKKKPASSAGSARYTRPFGVNHLYLEFRGRILCRERLLYQTVWCQSLIPGVQRPHPLPRAPAIPDRLVSITYTWSAEAASSAGSARVSLASFLSCGPAAHKKSLEYILSKKDLKENGSDSRFPSGPRIYCA